MDGPERLVSIELLGQQFKFYTAASEEELDSILTLVRSLVEADNTKGARTLPVSKIAILSCLNIASRYVKLQNEFELYQEQSGKRIAQLKEKIESTLAVD